MDPDVTVDTMRVIALGVEGGLSSNAAYCYAAEELAEQFLALDQWLTKGGFPPFQWQDNRP